MNKSFGVIKEEVGKKIIFLQIKKEFYKFKKIVKNRNPSEIKYLFQNWKLNVFSFKQDYFE